jgi:hypothetical protein
MTELEILVRKSSVLHEVDLYMSECMYDSVSQLTQEDLDYLASELQIGTAELSEMVKELA